MKPVFGPIFGQVFGPKTGLVFGPATERACSYIGVFRMLFVDFIGKDWNNSEEKAKKNVEQTYSCQCDAKKLAVTREWVRKSLLPGIFRLLLDKWWYVGNTIPDKDDAKGWLKFRGGISSMLS